MRWIKSALSIMGLVAVFTVPSFGQLGTLVGRVIGEDGERVEGATILIDRLDIEAHYEVATNDEGDYRYNGLPVGTYRITLIIDGRERRIENNVRIPFNEILTKNYDLSGADGGGGGISESAIQEAMNLARNALDAEDYPEAIRQFTIVVENDDTQPVVFANLAVAQERAQLYDEAGTNYQRAIDLALEQTEEDEDPPDEVVQWYDNMVVMFVNSRNFENSLAALEQLAQLDEERGATRYYDVGRVLVSVGQAQEAVDALQKSIAIDDERADAHYQLGLAYFGVGTLGDAIPPLERYLELEPEGAEAESARVLIDAARESQ